MASLIEGEGASLKDATLFVNVPFCIETPRYAHGRYLRGDGAAKREYLEAVMREVASLGDVLEGKRVVAVRIGGGSPSVVSPDQLGALMRLIRSELPMAHGAEMALEAIPNTVGVPSLTGWGQGKPSRIELRVGAIHLRDLNELHPPYRVQDIQNAVLFLGKFGMNNVSVSLVYGLPGQTEASWRQTLRKALDLEPYEVVVSPVSPADGKGLAQRRQRALYETAAALLEEHGLAEYAVGRFARAVGESAYVKALAFGADAAGVGLGAVSCVDGMAWRNTDDFEAYCAGSDDPERVVRDAVRLDDEARAVLAVRRALCLAEGVEAGCASGAVGELSTWEADGLVVCEGDRWRLTSEGRFAWQWEGWAL
ncbi:hypothetical protein B5F40_00735 [Gordonibacter sp. An230]|uniref:hypothetical protein n=1 Tax=Gordonibacter sp. An230 TaxID=1965592 RepID=UPI000B37CA71|nr:hypothetical protein [Gordonibacter sp. An230]OUO92458.1 hypothetical protein B5F40_00735 [Gordonibacter sp. An230]